MNAKVNGIPAFSQKTFYKHYFMIFWSFISLYPSLVEFDAGWENEASFSNNLKIQQPHLHCLSGVECWAASSSLTLQLCLRCGWCGPLGSFHPRLRYASLFHSWGLHCCAKSPRHVCLSLKLVLCYYCVFFILSWSVTSDFDWCWS